MFKTPNSSSENGVENILEQHKTYFWFPIDSSFYLKLLSTTIKPLIGTYALSIPHHVENLHLPTKSTLGSVCVIHYKCYMKGIQSKNIIIQSSITVIIRSLVTMSLISPLVDTLVK